MTIRYPVSMDSFSNADYPREQLSSEAQALLDELDLGPVSDDEASIAYDAWLHAH